MNGADVGTRQEHIIELFELWNDTLQLTEASHRTFPFSKFYQEKLMMLRNAVRILELTMKEGYRENFYAREINLGEKKK